MKNIPWKGPARLAFGLGVAYVAVGMQSSAYLLAIIGIVFIAVGALGWSDTERKPRIPCVCGRTLSYSMTVPYALVPCFECESRHRKLSRAEGWAAGKDVGYLAGHNKGHEAGYHEGLKDA